MELKFKKGTIVVATRREATGCGIEYIRKGSILKTSEDITSDQWFAEVYRNSREEKNENTHTIDVEKLRSATDVETECFKNGVYYTDEVGEIA